MTNSKGIILSHVTALSFNNSLCSSQFYLTTWQYCHVKTENQKLKSKPLGTYQETPLALVKFFGKRSSHFAQRPILI